MEKVNFRYLWYSEDYGMSDDFNTQEECENDARITFNENHGGEFGIYCYDSNLFPNGVVEIDDCWYLGYIGSPNY